MLIFKYFFDLINNDFDIIPYCGYYCSLLPINPTLGTSRRCYTLCGDSRDQFPDPDEPPFFQQNLRCESVFNEKLCYNFASFNSREKKLEICECVDLLKSQLLQLLDKEDPKDGDCLIYVPDHYNQFLEIEKFIATGKATVWEEIEEVSIYIREYNKFNWRLKNGEWLLLNYEYYTEPYSIYKQKINYLDRRIYYICYPLETEKFNNKLQYFKFFQMVNRPKNIHEILSKINIIYLNNYKFLTYEENGLIFISKPINNLTKKFTMGTVSLNEIVKDELLSIKKITYVITQESSEKYSKKNMKKIDQFLQQLQVKFNGKKNVKFLESIEYLDYDLSWWLEEDFDGINYFLKDSNNNFFEFHYNTHLVKNEKLIDDSLRYKFDTEYCMYSNFIPIEKSSYKTDCDFSKCKSFYDFKKITLHFCEDIIQDFKFCFRHFVNSLLEKDHIWELIEFRNKLYFQSASYLKPNYC